MFLFLYISAISGLQLKLIPLQYKRGDVQDQAYTAIITLNGDEQNMVVDSRSLYTWVYSKNPLTNQKCAGCPTQIQPYDCEADESCKKSDNQSPIQLDDQNECILMKENIILDSQAIIDFQICLAYKIHNKKFEINGLLSVAPTQETANSNLLNQLENLNKLRVLQITTTPGQERLFLGEQSNYFVKKTTSYQNQAEKEWKLQFQLYQKEEVVVSKEDNQFIVFDFATKFNRFTSKVIKQIIHQIKDYDGLFCSVEEGRLQCLCSKADFVDRIPTLKIGFNGQQKKFELNLDPTFEKDQQICSLNVFQDESQSILGNNFFQSNGAIFNVNEKTIYIGESFSQSEDPLRFDNTGVYCLLASILILFGLVSLLVILKQIKQEQLNKPKYAQPQEKPLYVISNTQYQFNYKPYNLELTTNQQLAYSRR